MVSRCARALAAFLKARYRDAPTVSLVHAIKCVSDVALEVEVRRLMLACVDARLDILPDSVPVQLQGGQGVPAAFSSLHAHPEVGFSILASLPSREALLRASTSGIVLGDSAPAMAPQWLRVGRVRVPPDGQLPTITQTVIANSVEVRGVLLERASERSEHV